MTLRCIVRILCSRDRPLPDSFYRMRTLPRHLVLAAVVLTVCCAQRQATAGSIDLGKLAEVSGQRLDDSRLVHQNQRQRRAQHRLIRPAAVVSARQVRDLFAIAAPLGLAPPTPVVHAIYPPSRFRLPPPAILA